MARSSCALTSESESLSCLSAGGASASGLVASKVETSPRATHRKMCRFSRRQRSPELLLCRHLQSWMGHCVLDKYPLVQPCRHRGRRPRRSWNLCSKHSFQIFHCRCVYLLFDADADLCLFLSGASDLPEDEHVYVE